jgi:hypothetical protein
MIRSDKEIQPRLFRCLRNFGVRGCTIGINRVQVQIADILAVVFGPVHNASILAGMEVLSNFPLHRLPFNAGANAKYALDSF